MCKEVGEQRQVPFKVDPGRGVLEVTLMLREYRLPILDQAERALQFSSQRGQAWRILKAGRKLDRSRRITARAPDGPWAPETHTDDRVIDAIHDAPIMRKKMIRDVR